ncbi:MAG: DUF6049 family protein [Actinomycetota bacterium]|nr:DUF6049 family protein [Actinomycetota bacterium]
MARDHGAGFAKVARLWGTLALLLSALLVPLATVASPAAGSNAVSISLSSGPSAFKIGTNSAVQLRVGNAPAGSYVEALLYSRMSSRSELQAVMAYGVRGYPLDSSQPLALAGLPRSGDVYTTSLSVLSAPPTSNQSPAHQGLQMVLPGCAGGCDGVYPLVLAVISGGKTVATHIVPVAVLGTQQPNIVPLGIALAIDASALPASGIRLGIPLIASVLASVPDQSLTLKLSAATLADAQSSKITSVRNAMAQIMAWATVPGHELSVTDVVPVNMADLTASGLENYFSAELGTARTLLSRAGTTYPITSETYLNTSKLSERGLQVLAKAGYRRIAVNASSVTQPDLKYALTAGLRLPVSGTGSMAVLSLDSQLNKDLALGTTTYEHGLNLISDMVQVFEDQPNNPTQRVLALNLPAGNSSEITADGIFAQRIAAVQVLHLLSLRAAFDSLSSAAPIDSWLETSLVRSQTRPVSWAHSFDATAKLLDSFAGATSDHTLINQMHLSLLESLDSTLPAAKVTHSLRSLTDSINGILDQVQLPSNRVVTLTSTKASIPISVTSKERVPLTLRLTMTSDRLRIKGGSSQLIKVGAVTNTATFVVSTKTLGFFQVGLSLTTPDGKVLVSSTALQVRSLTVTIEGVVLTIAALAVLGLWWIRTLRKGGGRNRRLLPAADGEGGDDDE